MGEAQSQLHPDAIAAAAVANGNGQLSAETLENFMANQNAAALASGNGGGAGAAGGGGGMGGKGDGNAACEPALLAQLVILLGQRQRNSLLLSDLGALLPGALRTGLKERGGLRSWLQRYPELFTVSGSPGKESVTLLLGAMHGEIGQAMVAFGAAGSAAGEGRGPEDEEDGNDAAVQLRGLPYKATVSDIRAFLGDYIVNLQNETSVQLVLNRDGRPSGFARVQFNSVEAAAAAKDGLHNRFMEVAGGGPPDPKALGSSQGGGQRYVEVFLYSERPNKLRFKKNVTSDGEMAASMSGQVNQEDIEALGITKEEVIQQCRKHMGQPGQDRLLLSMLGVALSSPARTYLKKTDQGLKHFLTSYPAEFSVDGAKGREMITYLPGSPLGSVQGQQSHQEQQMPQQQQQQKRQQQQFEQQQHHNQQQSQQQQHQQRLTACTLRELGPQQNQAYNHQMSQQQQRRVNQNRRTYEEGGFMPQSPKPQMVQFDVPGETPRGVNTPSAWGTPTPHVDLYAEQLLASAELEASGEHGSQTPYIPSPNMASYLQTPDPTLDGLGLPPGVPNWSAWGVPPPQFWNGGAGVAGPWGHNPWEAQVGATPDLGAALALFGSQTSPDFAALFGGSAAAAAATAAAGAGYYPGFPGGVPRAGLGAISASHASGAPATAPGASANSATTPPENTQYGGVPSPEIRLRGLPFNAKEQDVFGFFSKYDIVDLIADGQDAVRMVLKASGKPSGQAIVQMLSLADAMDAVQVLNGQYMGSRYIEVFMNPSESAEFTAGSASAAAAPGAVAPTAAAGAGAGGAPNENGDTGGSGNMARLNGNALVALAGAVSAGAHPVGLNPGAAAFVNPAGGPQYRDSLAALGALGLDPNPLGNFPIGSFPISARPPPPVSMPPGVGPGTGLGAGAGPGAGACAAGAPAGDGPLKDSWEQLFGFLQNQDPRTGGGGGGGGALPGDVSGMPPRPDAQL